MTLCAQTVRWRQLKPIADGALTARRRIGADLLPRRESGDRGLCAAYPTKPLDSAWAAIVEKYRAGEMSRDEYDKWRYYYPQYDDTQITAKVPSQELSDAMVKALRSTMKED